MTQKGCGYSKKGTGETWTLDWTMDWTRDDHYRFLRLRKVKISGHLMILVTLYIHSRLPSITIAQICTYAAIQLPHSIYHDWQDREATVAWVKFIVVCFK